LNWLSLAWSHVDERVMSGKHSCTLPRSCPPVVPFDWRSRANQPKGDYQLNFGPTKSERGGARLRRANIRSKCSRGELASFLSRDRREGRPPSIICGRASAGSAKKYRSLGSCRQQKAGGGALFRRRRRDLARVALPACLPAGLAGRAAPAWLPRAPACRQIERLATWRRARRAAGAGT
jgi:hypothetical protein